MNTTAPRCSSFGSLKNLNQRFLECLRFFELGEEAFASASGQIRLMDSS